MWPVWHQCWCIGTWIIGCTDILLSHPFPLNDSSWSVDTHMKAVLLFLAESIFWRNPGILWIALRFLRTSGMSYQSGCCSVAQSCLTLCNPMHCSPPVSSVQGISQARILQWLRNSSSVTPRDSLRRLRHPLSIGIPISQLCCSEVSSLPRWRPKDWVLETS